MASNTSEFDLQDLAERIRQPNEKMLQEFMKAEKQRTLTNKLAMKADKLIIRDSKANRRAAQRKPGGFTGRVAKRAGGAVMGGIGGAIGGIPIVGAIFRAIGQEAANTLKDKKNFQKELARQRKVELKLMDKIEEARQKKEQSELDAANPRPKPGRGTGGTGGASSASVLKLSNAAASLEAAAISLTPAIQTFDEIVVKIHDVVERLADHGGASKITDPQTLEYLHAIEFFTQETAATVEKIGANMGRGGFGKASNIVGPKALEYLHGIEFYAQESASKVENMESKFGELSKDLDLIRTYSYKTNMTSTRIEMLLKKAAQDRLLEIQLEKDQYKLQKKQYETQEETKMIGILGMIANFFGGTLMKGLAGVLEGLGSIAGPVLAVGAAAAIGVAIGNELNKYLQGNEIFEGFMNRVFDIFDNVLAKFGDKDAQARVKARDDMAFVQYGQELAKQSGIPKLDPATEKYLMENHTLPGIDKDTFANRGVLDGAFGNTVGRKSKDEMAQLMQNWQMDQAKPMLPGEDLIPASAGLEEAKAEAQAKRALRQQAIQQNTQTNNNNQTVIPQPLSADPAAGVQKSRNLGD